MVNWALSVGSFITAWYQYLVSDILESYARSPFLATETENFMDIRAREHQGENLLWLSPNP